MATYYWVGGSGTWDNSSKTNWATSSGGAGGFGPPITGDVVNFDSNSGASATVDVTATAACTTCTINKSDINLSLSGSPTFAGTLTLTLGTLTLNTYALTTSVFNSNNSNTRTIAFGTGKIVLTGNNTIIWGCNNLTNIVITGTPVVDCTYSGGTGTRTIQQSTALTESNAVSFNIKAGTDIIANANFNSIDFTGFSGTWSNGACAIYGSLTISTGMTLTASTGALQFRSTGSATIKSNGKTIDAPITINGVNGTFTLIDALTQGSTRAFTLTNGTFDSANKNVTIGTFALGTGTKTLTLGSGTWTVAGATWNANTNVTGLTVSASTGKIDMTSGSAKTFSGGGKTWPTLNQGGAGALTIAQSNTFADIANTVQPATVTLTAGTTQTVGAFSLSGTSGNLITLNTTSAGSQATLSDSSGTISLSYVSIQDIVATGGAVWRAYTSNGNVDAGNNLGWDFNFDSNVYTRRKAKVVYRR